MYKPVGIIKFSHKYRTYSMYSSPITPFLSHSSHWSYLLPKWFPFYFDVFETKFYILCIRENRWYLRLGVWLPVINMILSLQRVQLHSPLWLKTMPPSLHPFIQRWAPWLVPWLHCCTQYQHKHGYAGTPVSCELWLLPEAGWLNHMGVISPMSTWTSLHSYNRMCFF